MISGPAAATAAASPDVVVFDYGSGNLHSAVRALAHVGARVELTGDLERARECDGLLVPGVGNFHACMAGLVAADGPRLIADRISRGRPVLGVCVGMQVLFDGSDEPSAAPRPGIGRWPGTVARLRAEVVPHMGWSSVRPPTGSALFAGLADERFYFVHSYAVPGWPAQEGTATVPGLTVSEHGAPFLAAVEDGPLSATQFHPEKSGDAGLHLLQNWVRSL